LSGRLAKVTIATMAIIPDCGHAPSIEKSTDFLAVVMPFLWGVGQVASVPQARRLGEGSEATFDG
jgi:hypothetical protein